MESVAMTTILKLKKIKNMHFFFAYISHLKQTVAQIVDIL